MRAGNLLRRKRDCIKQTQELLAHTWVRTKHNQELSAIVQTPLQHDHRALDFLKRPEIHYAHLLLLTDLNLPEVPYEIAEQIDIQNKYEGYIERQQLDIEKVQKYEHTLLPASLDYTKVRGLSTEVVQKLNAIKPRSLGQASRISGITPVALSLLLVH